MVDILKILVLDIPASSSGALSVLKGFFSYITDNEKNHEWYFVVSTDQLISKNDNIHIIIEKFPKKNWFNRIIWEVTSAKKIIRKIKPDIILSLQNTCAMFTNVHQVLYVHHPSVFYKWKKQYRISIENVIFALYCYTFKFLIKRSSDKAKIIVVQTECMKDVLINTYNIDESKIIVIPPSVKITSNYLSLSSGYMPCQFFYPSTPMIYKNFEIIIDAVEILLKKGLKPIINFTIDGNENQYAKYIKEKTTGVEATFKFRGRLPRETVMEMYLSSVLLFPSYIETFGLPLLEARLADTYIIASDMPFCNEILEGYKKAYFFDPFCAQSLADKMEMCIFQGLENHPKDINYNFIDKFSPDNTWGKISKLLSDFKE